MSTRSLRLAIALGATALLAPAAAAAQSSTAEPNPRLGLYGGFGLHIGNISCDGENCGDFREAGGADGHLGYMLTDKLAIHGELWALTSSQNDTSLTFATATVGVRYWVAPIVWLQAGVGAGHATWRYSGFINLEGRSDDVAVVQLAAGVEVLRGKRWAMDLQGKLAVGTSTDDNGDNDVTGRMAGIGVGFTWF